MKTVSISWWDPFERLLWYVTSSNVRAFLHFFTCSLTSSWTSLRQSYNFFMNRWTFSSNLENEIFFHSWFQLVSLRYCHGLRICKLRRNVLLITVDDLFWKSDLLCDGIPRPFHLIADSMVLLESFFPAVYSEFERARPISEQNSNGTSNLQADPVVHQCLRESEYFMVWNK
jgi:hypothetical protein